MPSVIDELVIKIAFDIEGLKKRGDDTSEQLKRIRENAEKTGKDMEQSGKRAAQFFSAAKVEALALMSVLTGGAGLITAAGQTAASIAGLGRAAQNLNGMDPRALDAWGMALQRIGGQAENAVTSFNNIGAALARYKLKGDTSIIPFLNAIGAQTTMTPEQIAMKFSEYIKAHPEKTAQDINVIGQGLGMTQDMTNLLRQGPDSVRKELELSRTLGLRTQDMIDTAMKFQHDFEALNQAARHLTDRMMTKMMPTIDSFIVGLTKWITDNPDTATAAAGGVAVAGGALGSSAIARMLGLNALADALGGLTAVITKVSAVLGLLALTGPAGGPATAEQAAAAEKARGDPDTGISGWIRRKLGWSGTEAGRPLSPDEAERLTGRGAAAAAASGGSSAPTASQAGPRATAIVGQRASANAQSAFQWWKNKGLSDAAAAGMAAQETAESGGNPAARGDYVGTTPTAHGAYQWHPDRRAAILAGTGIDVSTNNDINQHREAAYWEYTHTERRTRDQLASVTDPTQAGRIATGFERPGLTEADKERERVKRGEIAAGILQKAQAAPVAGPRAPVPTPDPNLLPPPGERGEAPPPIQQHSSTSMDVGHITIHTAANDAHGIAKEIHGALSDKMIQQANRGLV